MRTNNSASLRLSKNFIVGMKPLSERDENFAAIAFTIAEVFFVGMKPLSERDENSGDSGL